MLGSPVTGYGIYLEKETNLESILEINLQSTLFQLTILLWLDDIDSESYLNHLYACLLNNDEFEFDTLFLLFIYKF